MNPCGPLSLNIARDHTERPVLQVVNMTLRINNVLRSRRIAYLSLRLLVCLCTPGYSMLVLAQPSPEWGARDYPYVVVNQSVRAVLEEFGRNLSIPVVISQNVSGRINGRIRSTSAQDFLDQVCRSHALAWFYDGSVLYISERSDLESQSFNLDGVDRHKLQAEIDRLKIGEPLAAKTVGDTLRAVGPSTWLSTVNSLVKDSRIDVSPSKATIKVRVFRGRAGTPQTTHATTADK